MLKLSAWWAWRVNSHPTSLDQTGVASAIQVTQYSAYRTRRWSSCISLPRAQGCRIRREGMPMGEGYYLSFGLGRLRSNRVRQPSETPTSSPSGSGRYRVTDRGACTAPVISSWYETWEPEPLSLMWQRAEKKAAAERAKAEEREREERQEAEIRAYHAKLAEERELEKRRRGGEDLSAPKPMQGPVLDPSVLFWEGERRT
jgi:hypothetical protein